MKEFMSGSGDWDEAEYLVNKGTVVPPTTPAPVTPAPVSNPDSTPPSIIPKGDERYEVTIQVSRNCLPPDQLKKVDKSGGTMVLIDSPSLKVSGELLYEENKIIFKITDGTNTYEYHSDGCIKKPLDNGQAEKLLLSAIAELKIMKLSGFKSEVKVDKRDLI